MASNPPVSVNPTTGLVTEDVPHTNLWLITFAAENATFRTNFAASTASWMFLDPNTLQGLVAELGPDNYRPRLKALGCPEGEPILTALDAYWKPLAQPDAAGNRDAIPKAPFVYIGRRTSAVVSINTFTFDTNTAGRVRIKVNEAKYLYANSTPAGSLADVTVEADGVLTVADLADDAAAALTALPDFAAHFTAVSDGVDTVTVTSLQPGYPLVLSVRSSTPGPTVTQAITTANVANAYRDDLLEMFEAAEYGELVDPPRRRFYWMTDIQGDDVVNAEGLALAEAQGALVPPRRRQYWAWSTSGARRVTIGGNFVGNFDPTSTASASEVASEANGGTGWTRGSVWDHDRYEFYACAMAGRAVAGYLPGETSFTSRVLQGAVAAARISPRSFGNDENLADDRRCNWYSAHGPGLDGSSLYGYQSEADRWVDQKWTEDTVEYFVTRDLLAWMQLKNIVTYTDADISGGAAVIAQAIARVPAVIADSIAVVSLTRDQVNPNNIVARIYYDYRGNGIYAGVINKIGTPSSPISIVISTS